MPGRDLTGSMDIAPSPNLSLFKAHKTFPRRKAQTGGRTLSHSLGLEQSRAHDEDQESYRSSQKIRSWIPEPSPHHAAPDHDLPLTPPINMMDHEEESWIEDRILADGIVASNLISSDKGIATPIIQRSPPTPETTPPRVHDGIRALAPRSPSPDPSLRADSFETARETLSSDDESPHIDSPSMRPARQTWLRDVGNSKLREIGLGLGLESEDEDPTPTQMTPKHSLKKYDFDAFDPSWWAGEKTPINNSIGINEEDHGLKHFDRRRRRFFQPRQRLPTHPLPPSPNTSKETTSQLARSLSLRQRVEKRQHNWSASTERFAELIDWPMKEDDFDLDAKLREVDNKRFSQISATSTVVEAMVIDTPPQRRQTLRHTGKIPPCNYETPQANHSNRSSMISTGSTRRRLPRNAITPDREKRTSGATDTSGSMNSSVGKVRQDTIPVIVIPPRRSLHPSIPTHPNVSGTMMLTSPRQQISRPTTAPEGIGYFDLPQRERFPAAAVIPLTTPSRPEPHIVEETPAVVVTSGSTAPQRASTETSQVLSVASANIVSSSVQPGQPHPVLHLSEPSEIQSIHLDRSIAGEWSALRPRSALVTPYSLRSTHSSTPGTLEVNEATAISIYPHTNKSILVIQQMAGGDANERAGHSAIIAGNASIALPGPIAPTMIHQSRRPLNSPLKNPRDPPQPPDFKIIPPTPANVPPTDETDLRRSPPSPKNRLSDTVSLVKRALSARRYSESFVSPITRSLARRSTINTHRPSIGDDPDSKLHPFWRPRGFWDDLSASSSDSDSEFGNSGFLVGSPTDAPPRKNSSSQAPNDRSISRSASLTRRLTGSLSLKPGNSPRGARTHRRSLSEGSQSNQPIKSKHSLASLENNHSYEFLQQSGRKRVMPRLGYPVQFIGFKGLAERMEKAKEKREEGRRERIRERLRGSIGVVKLGEAGLVRGGMNDLRR